LVPGEVLEGLAEDLLRLVVGIVGGRVEIVDAQPEGLVHRGHGDVLGDGLEDAAEG